MRIVGDALLHVFEIPRGVFIAVPDQGLERQGTEPTAFSVVKDIDGVSRRKMVLSLVCGGYHKVEVNGLHQIHVVSYLSLSCVPGWWSFL